MGKIGPFWVISMSFKDTEAASSLGVFPLPTSQLASAYTVSLCSDCAGEWLGPMSLLKLWLGVWGEGPPEGDARSCCSLSLVSRCSKAFFLVPKLTCQTERGTGARWEMANLDLAVTIQAPPA